MRLVPLGKALITWWGYLSFHQLFCLLMKEFSIMWWKPLLAPPTSVPAQSSFPLSQFCPLPTYPIPCTDCQHRWSTSSPSSLPWGWALTVTDPGALLPQWHKCVLWHIRDPFNWWYACTADMMAPKIGSKVATFHLNFCHQLPSLLANYSTTF